MPKEIDLRTGLTFMETMFIHGELNIYSVKYFKTNGETGYKPSVCKANPQGLYNFKAISEKTNNEGRITKKRGYSDTKERVITLWDLSENRHFSLKYDLLLEVSNNVNSFIINHEKQ